MTSPLTLLLVLALAAPAARAEIFKCVGKDAMDLYQNFPCQFETMGLVPMNLQAQETPHRPNTKGLTHDATLVGRSNSAQQTKPRLGMTQEAVRAMWGEPTDSRWEEPGEGERSELWSYGNSRSVRFINGRVSAIQQ